MMIDPDEFGREFGRSLARAADERSRAVEGRLTSAGISRCPIGLRPLFRPLDVNRTFLHRDVPRATPATAADSWAARRLLLPPNDKGEGAASVLAALAGCDGPLSFEAVVRRSTASVFLVAPTDRLSFYGDAWQGGYPEGLLLPATDPLQDLRGLRVFLDGFMPVSYDRRVTAAVSFWGQFFRLASLLSASDVLFCQFVFERVTEPWHQNVAALNQGTRSRGDAKNPSEPLFAAVLRFGSTNPVLAAPLTALMGSFTAAGLPFRYRSLDDFQAVLTDEEITSMVCSRSTHTIGQLLTSSELSHFVHPPAAGLAETIGLDVRRGLLVPDRLRHHGILLGTNTDLGKPIAVLHPWKDQYNTHLSIVGTSGKGKSTMGIANWVLELAKQEAGVCVIDPHRRLAELLVGTLGPVRDRVVYFDPDDPNLAVAYNPFAGVMSEDFGLYTDDFVNTIEALFATAGLTRTNQLLANGIYGLLVLGKNLATILDLFSRNSEGDRLRNRIMHEAPSDIVRGFWRDTFPTCSDAVLAPVVHRFQRFLLHEKTVRLFRQERNAVDIPGIVRDGKILICAMPAGIEACRILGGFLIGQVKHLALHRDPDARQFFLICDEFHRFGGSAFHDILDQTTKGHLSLWLAHQTTSQIPSELTKTIQGIDTVCFGVARPDAKHYASLFNDIVSAEILQSQPVGEAYARIGGDFVNFTCPPRVVPDPIVAAEIIAASHEQYYEKTPVPVARDATPAARVIETFE